VKTWHIAAIAVGSIAAIAIVAKVVSSSTSQEPQFSGPVSGGPAPDTGDAGARAVSGGFELGGRLLDAIAGKVARDDAARERERERQAAREDDSGAPSGSKTSGSTYHENRVTDPITKSRLMGRG
jgi:hypothetical protein